MSQRNFCKEHEVFRYEERNIFFFLCDVYLLTYSGILFRKSEDIIILVLKV